MWTKSNNHGFADEQDYLRSKKQRDSYSFTYSFEYIAKNYGNDNYDIETADMVVDLSWDDVAAGYTVSYHVPDMAAIDPAEGNSDAAGFYEHDVYWQLIADLDSIGIGVELRSF